jgi:hypothetical protein
MKRGAGDPAGPPLGVVAVTTMNVDGSSSTSPTCASDREIAACSPAGSALRPIGVWVLLWTPSPACYIFARTPLALFADAAVLKFWMKPVFGAGLGRS